MSRYTGSETANKDAFSSVPVY